MTKVLAAVAALALVIGGCAAETAGNGPGSSPRSGDGNGTSPERPPFDDRGRVGEAGSFLLSASIGRARVEIDSTTNETMTTRARDALAGTLREHGGKDVAFTGGTEIEGRDVYTAEDLRRLSREHRSVATTDQEASIHVLVLSGRFEREDALGVAFDATSFAIFPDRIRDGVLASLNYDRFEEAVVVHELGHLFGLVNLTGEGGFHEDADSPGHSENQGSVMYWAVEDVSIGNVFRGGPPTSFDADDRREMDRIRA